MLTETLGETPSVKVATIFSHLNCSDMPQEDRYTREQIARFDRMSGRLAAALPYPVLRHTANSAAIEAICGVDGLFVDVGGGVRSLARIDELAGYGARRIALGTVLVTEPGFAEVAAQGFGELLVADIAARDGQVKVNGWRDGAGVALDDAVAQLTELGFKHLVYTDIARDGMQTGIDVAAYRHVAEVAGFPVVASGGISTLDDIRALAAVGEGAIEGAITGRALYEGNFTLVQALTAARGEE